MASILSYILGRTKVNKPSPRWCHYAAPVGGKCFLWGGRVPDFSASGRKKLASTVEIFDPYLEVWEQKVTTGVSPPGLYDGACASISDQLYSFGGYDGTSLYNSLHTMDPTSLEWKEVRVLNQDDLPMKKLACRMVAYNQDRLALLGGFGIPTGPIQPGVRFIRDTSVPGAMGWTEEFHIFNINEGKWSIPTTTGPRPPPCIYMSFTAINDHEAVMFGGNQPGNGGYSDDCYLINFETMEWIKLERSKGAPWPKARDSHAACCLNYGQDDPQLLVTGGVDKNLDVLSDIWILDIKSGRWRELALPEGTQARLRHTVTAFSLEPERTQVTMLGGCPKWDLEKPPQAQAKIAETTVLEFETVLAPPSGGGPSTQEWVLVGVAGSSHLGSKERIREKLLNLQGSVLREVEAGQKALQEVHSQQARVQDAEARAKDLKIQLEASEDAFQHSLQDIQQSLQALQAEKRFLEGALQKSQAEKTALQDKLATAEQNVQEAENQVQYLQQRVDESRVQTADLQQRVEDAEHRAQEAERRVRDARQGASEGEASWVVQRDEINLTDVEVGRGGWAVVQVAEFRGAQFAAKCLYGQIVSNYNRLLFTREMNMASRVRHPNLLQFIGATVRGELIILTELMPTSVRRELENERIFSHNQVSSISLDVARALNYLHLMQPSPLVHRDISSANVLLEPRPNNSWRAKVSDYGSVNLLTRLKTSTPGNPTYAAPEAENTDLQSPKMDIFSFGVLLVEMCTAQFPEVSDRDYLISSIQQHSMVALIRHCLAEDRNARPSASDIITELNK